jgi:hypothetical protein
MPTTFRLFFLLMLGLFGLQPVSYGYDAPVSFVSEAQNIVAASPEGQAATAESAASVPVNFNREGTASDRQAETRTFSNFVAAETAAATTSEGASQGMQLFRVFGDDAKGLGNYYTTVDPSTVANFRDAAGLFPGNTGRFVLEGTLNDTEGVIVRTAAPGPGGAGGGLPEVYVPNPQTQINIRNVSGINPPY